LFAACKITRSVDGGVEGKNGFHAEGLHYLALEKKRRLGLEVCRLDGARWIHADTALPMKR
jgi:hypothetical protein